MEEPTRFYVPPDVAYGSDGIREGVRWLLQWVDQHPETGRPLIVAPTRNQLQSIDILAAACAAMDCESFRSVGWERRTGPTLLLFPDRKVLGEFDQRPSPLCVVPTPSEPIDYWVTARQAVDVTGSVPSATPQRELVANPVVREALHDIGVVVNKAHLVNYEDRAIAVRVLKILERANESFTPTEVHSWALATGWSPDAASRLREIAEGVLAGRSFRLKSAMAPRRGALKQWRKRAAEGDPA